MVSQITQVDLTLKYFLKYFCKLQKKRNERNVPNLYSPHLYRTFAHAYYSLFVYIDSLRRTSRPAIERQKENHVLLVRQLSNLHTYYFSIQKQINVTIHTKKEKFI